MKTIAVLGAGYAGLRAVKILSRIHTGAHIVLVNKNPYHYESTQLHQIAAGTKEPADITFNITNVVQHDVEVIIDEVREIDRSNHQVLLHYRQPLSYDYLINALGFESETFGIKGAKEYGWPLVDIDTAIAARAHLERTLFRYASSRDDNDLHIAVCGAGFTSIEYLGELVYRLPKLIKRYRIPVGRTRMYCIEASDSILPMLPKNLTEWAVNFLEKRGVEFHTSTPITEVRQGAVVSGDNEFTANTIIWTTGVCGSHVIADSGYDQKRDRVIVGDDLSVQGHPEEFLIGDVSAVLDPQSGRLYPATAQISVAQADQAARNVAALLTGKPTKKFIFNSSGTVCSLGPCTGVAEIEMMGHWKLKGPVVGILKKIINDRSVLELANIKTMLRGN